MSKLSMFLRRENGNVSILFALILVPVVTAMGVAVDYSRMSGSQTQIQAALDAAVLAGVAAPAPNQESVARSLFDSNVPPGLTIKSQAYTLGTNTLTGEVNAEFRLFFGWFVDLKTANVAAKSTAKVDVTSTPTPSPSTGVACILALDPSKVGAFLVNGPALVNAPDCEVHVKSTASPAAMFNTGGTPLDMKRICVEGSNVMKNMSPISNLQVSCNTASNPYVGRYPAPATACNYSDTVYFSSVTMNPGVYCGNTVFMGNSNVTLNPGVYVVKNGSWTLNGQINITGSGVTFYFPDTSSILFNGPISVDLKAPISGTYKSVLMFEADGLPKSPFILNGTANNQMDGLIYLPSRDVVTQAASTTGTYRTTIVVNSMVWNAVRYNLFANPDTAIAAPGPILPPTVSKKPYLVY